MADLGQSHPELVKRYNRLVGICWERGWYVGITSSTRSYAEQRSLWRAYQAGVGNEAADPDAVVGPSPWGWKIHGSYHMVQADGYSHALDLHWQQCSAKQFESAANLVGLRLTVPGENWHFQWFDTRGVFEPLLPEPLSPEFEEDEMTPLIHRPEAREGAPNVWDFTFVPAHTLGRPVAGWNCSSVLVLRRRGGAAPKATVYQQGVPTEYALPEDGTTLTVPIVREGLLSVVGDVICHVREQWARG